VFILPLYKRNLRRNESKNEQIVHTTVTGLQLIDGQDWFIIENGKAPTLPLHQRRLKDHLRH